VIRKRQKNNSRSPIMDPNYAMTDLVNGNQPHVILNVQKDTSQDTLLNALQTAGLSTQVCTPLEALLDAVDVQPTIMVTPAAPSWIPALQLSTRFLHGRPVVVHMEHEPEEGNWVPYADGIVFANASLAHRVAERFGNPARSIVLEDSRPGWAAFLKDVQGDHHQRLSKQLDRIKRVMDVGASLSILTVAAPALAVVALSVAATMGRPVLFRQQRPGKNGVPFGLVKFRTMRDALPHEQGPEHDVARITRLGRFLRATSLDELPTLLNVLRGEMSLVGPRPLLMRYLERYTPEQAKRHNVRPGITGWAQVNGRNRISWEEKFALDVWYIQNRTLALEGRILLQTLLKVLRREDIDQGEQITMPEFTG